MTIDRETAQKLNELNAKFYALQASSFDQTRKAPWNGWRKLAERIQNVRNLSVLDLACGNLRFERFLVNEFPETQFTFNTVDNCPALMPEDFASNHAEIDLVQTLLDAQKLELTKCDLSVSFGFMHHIPTSMARKRFLELLMSSTKPGGLVAVSFWQFMGNEKLAAKAIATTESGLQELSLPDLEANDYLIGWQDKSGVYRYCHHFSDSEIDVLADSVAADAELIESFQADGRTDNLNRYLIFKRKPLG